MKRGRDLVVNLMGKASKRMLSSLPKSVRGVATRFKVTRDRMRFTRKRLRMTYRVCKGYNIPTRMNKMATLQMTSTKR